MFRHATAKERKNCLHQEVTKPFRESILWTRKHLIGIWRSVKIVFFFFLKSSILMRMSSLSLINFDEDHNKAHFVYNSHVWRKKHRATWKLPVQLQQCVRRQHPRDIRHTNIAAFLINIQNLKTSKMSCITTTKVSEQNNQQKAVLFIGLSFFFPNNIYRYRKVIG